VVLSDATLISLNTKNFNFRLLRPSELSKHLYLVWRPRNDEETGIWELFYCAADTPSLRGRQFKFSYLYS